MSPQRAALLYFRDRMREAGYNAELGEEVPELARAPKNGEILVELWLTDAQPTFHENNTYANDYRDNIECYAFRVRKAEDREGLWYDDVQAVFDTLTFNPEDRVKREHIWWDGETASIDRISPLKNWDNGNSYSQQFKCARIDLPINYMRGLAS